MPIQAKIEVTGPNIGHGTLEYYEETSALYARDAKGGQRRAEIVNSAVVSLNELDSAITWGGLEYRVDDVESARAFVETVHHAIVLKGGRPIEASANKQEALSAVAARLRAFKSGSLLETLGILYGIAAVIGAIALAIQEDSFGDRPYFGVGAAAGFVGIVLATFLVAFGRLVTAWALTHGIEEGTER